MNAQMQNHSSEQIIGEGSQSALLDGDRLKQAVNELRDEIMVKILTNQNGIPTFFDSRLLLLIDRLQQLDTGLPWEESIKQLDGEREELGKALQRLRLFLWRRGKERFVDFHDRLITIPEGSWNDSDIGVYEIAMSQGVSDCMQWKAVPLFKTVFDFSLYTMMLWDLKPKTIIELGSGMGASATWLADIMKIFKIKGKVYSIDLNVPKLKHNGVSFIQGDCSEIEKIFENDSLANALHPWLMIEDAHVNVYGVLFHFHSYLLKGDYVVIEDSKPKRDDISKFVTEYPNCYKVDTYYTDFFGRNATCAKNSIFARVS